MMKLIKLLCIVSMVCLFLLTACKEGDVSKHSFDSNKNDQENIDIDNMGDTDAADDTASKDDTENTNISNKNDSVNKSSKVTNKDTTSTKIENDSTYYEEHLVGVWNNGQYSGGAGYLDHYQFNEDGTFTFMYNEFDGEKRVIGFSGNWNIVFDNFLYLTILQKAIIEGGQYTNDPASETSDYVLRDGNIKLISLETPETIAYPLSEIGTDDSFYPTTIQIGGKPYWQFSTDGDGNVKLPRETQGENGSSKPSEETEKYSEDEIQLFKLISQYDDTFEYSDTYTAMDNQSKEMNFDNLEADQLKSIVFFPEVNLVQYTYDFGTAYREIGLYFIIDEKNVTQIKKTVGTISYSYQILNNGVVVHEESVENNN